MPKGKENCKSSADLVGMPFEKSIDKDKAVERVPSAPFEKRAKEKETAEVMGNAVGSDLDKDEVVDCDSETETDNGKPHPRWVPSAQANGPRCLPSPPS